MSEFFIGQVMLTGFAFAPKYFAQCNGQLLPINQNQALFSLLSTRFGGDGKTTFGLPDMRGRTPVGYGPSADP
ncbi:microcystin-dependent protein, partial [Xanthomonas oryzae pv. oryzae]